MGKRQCGKDPMGQLDQFMLTSFFHGWGNKVSDEPTSIVTLNRFSLSTISC
jgi:hypothetical protein